MYVCIRCSPKVITLILLSLAHTVRDRQDIGDMVVETKPFYQ